MSLGNLVVAAVKVEGRTKSEVARSYGVSRQWVHELIRKLHGFWYAFGTHDGYNLWEAPDMCPWPRLRWRSVAALRLARSKRQSS